MRYIFLILLLLIKLTLTGQRQLNFVVADSLKKHALPFATVRLENKDRTLITSINGQINISVLPNGQRLHISYVSYQSRTLNTGDLKNGDTLFLVSVVATLGEVIVRPQPDKIRHIVNAAIRNKSSHNPELYDRYQCNIYYKMKLDMVPTKKKAC